MEHPRAGVAGIAAEAPTAVAALKPPVTGNKLLMDMKD
jgi:hypothetical protein